jgi:FkbM family methyltransferase
MIIKVHEKIQIICDNSLEEYRAESFFKKEPETIAWMNSFSQNQVFYDIGANIGQYSLYASLHAGSTVYSFEPYFKNYVRIKENAFINEIKENFYPLFCALSDRCSLDKFFVKDDRISSSGHQLGINVDEHGKEFDAKEEYPIFVYSIDFLLENFNIQKPNHIKIDVDGNEGRILAGMKKTLVLDSLISVLIEVNSQGEEKNNAIKMFSDFGFTIDNEFNVLDQHSRNRRKGTKSEIAENIVFTKA